MPHQVHILPDAQVLELAFTGDVTIADRRAGLDEILVLLDDTGYRRVLVNFLRGTPALASLEESKRHAANLARVYASFKGISIAYVGPDIATRAPSPVEVLAAARGYFYERFTDRDMALHWLAG